MRKFIAFLLVVVLVFGIYLFSQFFSFTAKKTFGQAKLVFSEHVADVNEKYSVKEV